MQQIPQLRGGIPPPPFTVKHAPTQTLHSIGTRCIVPKTTDLYFFASTHLTVYIQRTRDSRVWYSCRFVLLRYKNMKTTASLIHFWKSMTSRTRRCWFAYCKLGWAEPSFIADVTSSHPSSPILSYPILSCCVSYRILSYLVLSYLVLSYLIYVDCPVLSCPILSYLYRLISRFNYPVSWYQNRKSPLDCGLRFVVQSPPPPIFLSSPSVTPIDTQTEKRLRQNRQRRFVKTTRKRGGYYKEQWTPSPPILSLVFSSLGLSCFLSCSFGAVAYSLLLCFPTWITKVRGASKNWRSRRIGRDGKREGRRKVGFRLPS